MVSPEKEDQIGQDLFKYEGAKDWMKKTDWDQCMADYSEVGAAKGRDGSNFAADTYELVVKYEDGSVKIQPIDPMAIFEYGGVGKYLKDLERRLGLGFEIKTSL